MDLHMLNVVDEANRQLARELAEGAERRRRADGRAAIPQPKRRIGSAGGWFHRPRHIPRLRLGH